MNSAFLSMTPDERNAYIAREAREYRERKSAAANAADDGQSASPLPLRREPPPGDAFPVDALGPILGGAVRGIVSKIQCPDALAAGSVLAAAALASQGLADVVNPATGAARPISLFLVTVAASGDRKSAADFEAMAPLRHREKQLRDEYEIRLPEYRREKRAFDVALATAEKKSKGSWQEIAEALRAVGDEPRAPLLPFLMATEPTAEGVCKLFEKGQPSLGVFSDEAGSFLGGVALNAENRLKTLAMLSTFWDGQTVRRIRAADGASALAGKRLALHLMAQPGVAESLLADSLAANQGFLARCLVTAPASLAGTRFHKPASPDGESGLALYRGALATLLEMPMTMAPGAANVLEPRKLTFDGRASGAWLRLSDEIERQLGPGGAFEQIRAFAAKLGEHVSRIAAILALVENPDAREINSEIMGRAAALGDFYASEALRLFEASAVSPEILQAEKLLAWLHAWPEPAIGLLEIYQRGPSSIRERAAAQKAVTVLESHGWLRRIDGGTTIGGRRAREAWRIIGRD